MFHSQRLMAWCALGALSPFNKHEWVRNVWPILLISQVQTTSSLRVPPRDGSFSKWWTDLKCFFFTKKQFAEQIVILLRAINLTVLAYQSACWKVCNTITCNGVYSKKINKIKQENSLPHLPLNPYSMCLLSKHQDTHPESDWAQHCLTSYS